jgi:hypothetical protein
MQNDLPAAQTYNGRCLSQEPIGRSRNKGGLRNDCVKERCSKHNFGSRSAAIQAQEKTHHVYPRHLTTKADSKRIKIEEETVSQLLVKGQLAKQQC